MFDRHAGGESAVLVHVDFPDTEDQEDRAEFVDLVVSAGLDIRALVSTKRGTPHPKFYIGTGKADEVADVVKAEKADVLLFNHALSPAQERNLERLCQCRVVDRTGLILDIFAQRAHSHEGKLQVELAQLRHLSTRLVRGWTHLERQKGGIGLRGPGETQLETDRRLLRDRIKTIERRLSKVERQRNQGRRARQRADIPTVSLVGYTNAGKSTLFNRIAASEVYAADQLFATLDPTLRRVELDSRTAMILADTVGFIRHLPHDLVAAFKATLQESRDADILLHVIDAADERRDDNIEAVDIVLQEIGADEVPQLQVFNKLDLLEDSSARIERNEQGLPVRVWLSAMSGEGMELLNQALIELLAQKQRKTVLRLPPERARLRGLLFNLGCVQDEQQLDDGGSLLSIQINWSDWIRLERQENLSLERFEVDEAEPH